MPKRTNFFQKLITQIYKQLSGSAIVTESKMLVDKDTGSLVEVDIVIESHVGLVPIIIGIECTSKSRPADLVWYRQLVKKHEDLPISKTVLVSESGFTEDVYKKARIDNVELLTLEEAIDTRWIDFITKINNGTVVHVNFRPTKFGIQVNGGEVKEPTKLAFSYRSIIEESGKQYQLVDYLMKAAQEMGVTRWVMKNYRKLPPSCKSIEISFIKDTDPKIILTNNERVSIKEFDLTLEFYSNESRLAFNSGRYSDRNIAYSEFDNIFSNSKDKGILTFVENEQGAMIGSITYMDDNKKEINLELQLIHDVLNKK